MEIVRCTEAHLESLVKLIQEYRKFFGCSESAEAVYEFFQERMRLQDSATFMALQSGTEIGMGFVNLYPSFSTLSLKPIWILNDLGVSRSYSGHGVAKSLILKAQEFALETGAIRIELKSEKANEKALSLYESVGFSVDHEHVYYRVPIQ